jgi:hypothetical protein
MSLAWLLLLLVSERVLLMDDVYAIPPGDWRYVEVGLKQRAATVQCDFEVQSGGSGVRVALVTRGELDRFRRGRSHDVLGTTNYERSGRLRVRVPGPGEYALVVDNRMEGRGRARVALRVFLDFAAQPPQQARTLPPARRWLVVSASVLFFLAITWWAGRKLLAAWRTR